MDTRRGRLYNKDFTGEEKSISPGEKVIYFDYRISASINQDGNLYVFSGTESDGPNANKAKYILIEPGQTYIYLDEMQNGPLELGPAGTYVFTGIASEEPNVGKIIYVLKAGSMKSVEENRELQGEKSSIVFDAYEEEQFREEKEVFPEDPPGAIRVREFISRLYEVNGKIYKSFRWDQKTGETVLVPIDGGADDDEDSNPGLSIHGDLEDQTINWGENNEFVEASPMGIDIASLVEKALSMKPVQTEAKVSQKDDLPEIPKDILAKLSSFKGHQLIKTRGENAVFMASKKMTDNQINNTEFEGTWVQWGELPETEYDIWVKEK